jgi:hypothetical protein
MRQRSSCVERSGGGSWVEAQRHLPPPLLPPLLSPAPELPACATFWERRDALAARALRGLEWLALRTCRLLCFDAWRTWRSVRFAAFRVAFAVLRSPRFALRTRLGSLSDVLASRTPFEPRSRFCMRRALLGMRSRLPEALCSRAARWVFVSGSCFVVFLSRLRALPVRVFGSESRRERVSSSRRSLRRSSRCRVRSPSRRVLSPSRRLRRPSGVKREECLSSRRLRSPKNRRSRRGSSLRLPARACQPCRPS